MSVPKLIDVTPFEPNIIKVHYDGFDWESLRPVCNKIMDSSKDNAPIEIGDAKSSVYSKNAPHLNKEFKNFYNWLNPIVKHVVYNEWSYNSDFKYDIGMSWVNVHRKGGVTLEHNHGTVVIVAATYLQLEPGMGYIEFKDPLEYVKGFIPRWEKNVTEWKTIPAKTGDTFLFPGWLRHKTQDFNKL